MRRIVSIAGALALAGVLVASVGAGTIVGTKGNDVLRGTKKADTLNGKAGNDTEYGLDGNDTLNGGSGNDKLIGGKGKDRYQCGPGKDTVIGDSADAKPGADCEVVKGIEAAPPPPPPAPKPQCSDGIDNDGDGLIDFPADKGCTSADDNDEVDPPPAKAGHYTGTTNQAEPIGFDVAPDGKSFSNVDFKFNGSCTPGGYVSLADWEITAPGPYSINPDGTFSIGGDIDFGTAQITGSVTMSGAFTQAGTMSGTLRLDMKIFVPGLTLSCSTGNTTFTAQASG